MRSGKREDRGREAHVVLAKYRFNLFGALVGGLALPVFAEPSNAQLPDRPASMNFWVSRSLVVSIGFCLQAIGFPLPAFASPKQEARLTQITQDVQVVTADGAAHPASANESIHEGMTVRTGAASRVEVTFTDQSIARLGANSVFDFKDGARNLELRGGAMLLEAPRNAKGAKIHTAGFAAAITGTTIVFESYPTHYKFLVLDGTGRLYRPGHFGDSILVGAGQMVFGQPNAALSDPVDFDIARFLKTCRFIVDFPPLPSEKLMALASEKQQRAKSKKTLIDTNLVIFGGGTVVSLTNPAQTNAASQPTAASATPESDAIPSSTDLGTIETPPKPAVSQVGAPAVNPAADIQR